MNNSREDPWKEGWEKILHTQLLPRGIYDPVTLNAMASVPRHFFVPEHLRNQAYHDRALPIEAEQTISQPYIVALMTQEARLCPSDHVLEVGTGSGYAAAILSRIVKQVHTLERIETLYLQAKERFSRISYENIYCHLADGSQGWKENAPYDAILVTAASPEEPPAPLLEQLKEKGRLVIPVGDRSSQLLCCYQKNQGVISRKVLESVRFVPLIGRMAWDDQS